jgi:hypothetical protein
VISGAKVPEAWEPLKGLAGQEAPPEPNQEVLELILAATHGT